MKNPLALFTGAALATLAALAGLNMTDWRPTGSIGDQKPAEAAGGVDKPAVEEGPSKAPEKPAEEASQPPEKAAEEPDKASEKPAEIAAVLPQEPPKTEPEARPEFDTVRVEKDGQAVVAGRAEPGAEVSLRLGEQVIGKGIANADGSWVVVPDNPLPKGAHELTVEQKTADSAPVTSAQSVAVAVPETAGQQTMVALTEPGTATKVLQTGGGQQAAASETAKTPEPEQQAKAPEAAGEPPETGQAAGVAQESPAGDEQPAATAEKQPEGTEPAKRADEPVAQTTTVAKTEELPEAVKPPETTSPTAEPAETAAVPLHLDAVDYNDQGDIIFSGRAKAGTAIRLYVDNGRVGDAMVDAQGNWSFSGKDIIAPGTHNLRADQIDATGKVIARIELPFLRENAEAVAALNTPPESEPEEAPAQPKETQPSQAMEAQPPQTGEVPAPPATDEQPSQPAGTQPQQTTEVQPPQAPETEPQQTTEVQPPQAPETEPQQTTEVQPPQAPDTEPQQTTEVQPPQAPDTEPQQTTEVQPPQTTEMTKAEPEASDPAPEQPVAEGKNEEVTTAAAAAAEQTAKAIDPNKPRSGKVVIQPGNNLWKLSRVIYGRGIQYTVIYQANKDQIRNPNRIYPGQIFAIPNATPPETIDPKRKDPLTSAEGGTAQ